MRIQPPAVTLPLMIHTLAWLTPLLLLSSCSLIPQTTTTVYALADQKALPSSTQRELLCTLPFPGMEYEINEPSAAFVREKAAPHLAQEQLLILGAADAGLPPEYARTLGQRRAEAVRKLLIEEGWPPERLHPTTVGNDLTARTSTGFVQLHLLRKK